MCNLWVWLWIISGMITLIIGIYAVCISSRIDTECSEAASCCVIMGAGVPVINIVTLVIVCLMVYEEKFKMKSKEIDTIDEEISQIKADFKLKLNSAKKERAKLVKKEKMKRQWNKLGITRDNVQDLIDHLNEVKLGE